MALLASLTPNFATIDSPDTAVAIAGSGFRPSAIARFNGSNLTTTFVDSGHLTTTIPAADLMVAGVFPVDVLSNTESLDFNHDHQSAVISPCTLGDGASAMTFSMWFELTGTPTSNLHMIEKIVDMSPYGPTGVWRIQLTGSGSITGATFNIFGDPTVIGSAGVVYTTTFGGALGAGWYNLVFSWLGSPSGFPTLDTHAAYLNNVPLTLTFVGGSLSTQFMSVAIPGSPVTIGAIHGNGDVPGTGQSINPARLCHLSFFNQYYDSSQVSQYLWNGGCPADLVAVSAPGLLAWLPMDGDTTDVLGGNNATRYSTSGDPLPSFVMDEPCPDASSSLPFTVLALDVDLFPKVDTFRGGQAVVIHGSPRLVDKSLDVSFEGQTLPSGWTGTFTGSGSVRPNFDGTLLVTGTTPSSTARIATASVYSAFEATLTATPLAPDQAPGSEVDPLIFEFFSDSINYAQIRVRRLPLIDSTKLIVDSVIGLQDELLVGGGLILPLQTLELRIIRYANLVYLFVNGVKIAGTSRFLSSSFGALRATTLNLSASTKVSTRLTSLTLRSHVLIGGRLIEDKIDFSERRVLGKVPAASLAEVGTTSIIAFGPWGSAALTGPFEYTLPAGRGLGGQLAPTFTSFDDPVVRD